MAKMKTHEDNAWRVTSKYIRSRDCLATTQTLERGACYTCGRQNVFSELDAGHFVSRKAKLLMFDEDNLKTQCRRCNRFLDGNIIAFYPKLLAEIGPDRMAYLTKNRWVIHKFTIAEYAHIKTVYQHKLEVLLDEYRDRNTLEDPVRYGQWVTIGAPN